MGLNPKGYWNSLPPNVHVAWHSSWAHQWTDTLAFILLLYLFFVLKFCQVSSLKMNIWFPLFWSQRPEPTWGPGAWTWTVIIVIVKLQINFAWNVGHCISLSCRKYWKNEAYTESFPPQVTRSASPWFRVIFTWTMTNAVNAHCTKRNILLECVYVK